MSSESSVPGGEDVALPFYFVPGFQELLSDTAERLGGRVEEDEDGVPCLVIPMDVMNEMWGAEDYIVTTNYPEGGDDGGLL